MYIYETDSQVTETVVKYTADNGEMCFKFIDSNDGCYSSKICRSVDIEYMAHNMILCTPPSAQFHIAYIIEPTTPGQCHTYYIRRKIWFENKDEYTMFCKCIRAI
jgi:hypothetical protein